MGSNFSTFHKAEEKFPVWINITSVHIIRAHKIPGNIIEKISTNRHIVVKCLGYKNNDKKNFKHFKFEGRENNAH